MKYKYLKITFFLLLTLSMSESYATCSKVAFHETLLFNKVYLNVNATPENISVATSKQSRFFIATHDKIHLLDSSLNKGFLNLNLYKYINGQKILVLESRFHNEILFDQLVTGVEYEIEFTQNQSLVPVNFSLGIVTPDNLPVQTLQAGDYIDVETGYSPFEIIDLLIDNPCVSRSNPGIITGTNFNLDVNGVGYFTNANPNFPMQSGIVLSTGKASNAAGPATNSGDGSAAWLDDDQLTNYLNGILPATTYHNATVLEFDFVPISDNMSFDFIFASNEYGSFQCSYSDAFAFFLTDNVTNTTNNLAIVPNTNDPISVITVRKGIHSPEDWQTGEPECGDVNAQYFDKLYDPSFNGLAANLSPINYKGHTVKMQASSTVIPGRSYKIKLVVQDRQDSILDSAVFIEAGSFDVGSIDLGADLSYDNNEPLCNGGAQLLDSGLNPDLFTIKWYKDGVLIPGANEGTYNVTESGTYKIEAVYTGTECALEDTVKVDIFPALQDVLNQPKPISICAYDEWVDLTSIEDDMFNTASINDYTIGYYTSLNNAQAGTAKIVNPTQYNTLNGTTLYVKAEHNVYGCIGIFEFNVENRPIPSVTSLDGLLICDMYKLPKLKDTETYFTKTNREGDVLTEGTVMPVGEHTLYISNIVDGCISESVFYMNIISCQLPKGISPNGDGNNDFLDLSDYHAENIKIYNRYGGIVYERDNYRNEWFGQNNRGEELPSGTYFIALKTPYTIIEGWIYLTKEIK